VSTPSAQYASQEDALRKCVAELEAALASVTAERDKLRRAYEQLKGHLDLLRRRIFVAKAERMDTRQLELEFAETKAKLDALATDPALEGVAERIRSRKPVCSGIAAAGRSAS
jgi:phage shock protein A